MKKLIAAAAVSVFVTAAAASPTTISSYLFSVTYDTADFAYGFDTLKGNGGYTILYNTTIRYYPRPREVGGVLRPGAALNVSNSGLSEDTVSDALSFQFTPILSHYVGLFMSVHGSYATAEGSHVDFLTTMATPFSSAVHSLSIDEALSSERESYLPLSGWLPVKSQPFQVDFSYSLAGSSGPTWANAKIDYIDFHIDTVPEPETEWLMVPGLLSLGALVRRQRMTRGTAIR